MYNDSIEPDEVFKEKRQFVNREKHIFDFETRISQIKTDDYNIMVYYGITGVGKSRLLNKLEILIDEKYPDVVHTYIDFNTENHQNMIEFLRQLRFQLKIQYKVDFNLFDIAYSIYKKKVQPDSPLSDEAFSLIEKGSSLDLLIEVVNTANPVRLLVEIKNFAANAKNNFKIWWDELRLDISKIIDLKPFEIENLLPIFFASDFNKYLNERSRSAVLFIDTYDNLWGTKKHEGNYYLKDEWVRTLVRNIPGISWVIGTQNKIKWEKINRGWKNYLNWKKNIAMNF